MSSRNTLVRSLHDTGLAAWFGGSLMGAIGLNAAAAAARDPRERITLSAVGWKRFAPVLWTAIAVHGVGGAGLILTDKARLAAQPGARTNTGLKLGLTLAAVGASAASAVIGARMGAHQGEPVDSTTEPAGDTSSELTTAQKQQRVLQWITPALTLTLIVLPAQQGEQQRPAAGWLQRVTGR